jgi:hypothetical protein
MRLTAILTTVIIAAAAGSAAAAMKKERPHCAALTFRPVPPDVTDGEQDAGFYKSRFGRIALKAEVTGGKPRNYFVEIDGKPPTALTGALPPGIAQCAKAKRLGAVGEPPPTCVGDRFAVLVDHIGEERYVLLFAHDRGDWRFCSAGST